MRVDDVLRKVPYVALDEPVQRQQRIRHLLRVQPLAAGKVVVRRVRRVQHRPADDARVTQRPHHVDQFLRDPLGEQAGIEPLDRRLLDPKQQLPRRQRHHGILRRDQVHAGDRPGRVREGLRRHGVQERLIRRPPQQPAHLRQLQSQVLPGQVGQGPHGEREALRREPAVKLQVHNALGERREGRERLGPAGDGARGIMLHQRCQCVQCSDRALGVHRAHVLGNGGQDVPHVLVGEREGAAAGVPGANVRETVQEGSHIDLVQLPRYNAGRDLGQERIRVAQLC